MPQVLAVAIIAAFPTTAAVVAGVAIATYIATAVILLGTLAYSMSQKRKGERAARAQFDASQVDRLANIPGTVAQRELVFGRLRKGGHVFFRGSAGPFQSTFAMCISVAEHEIDGIEEIYFNDQIVSVIGGQVITPPYGRYRRESAGVELTTAVSTLSGTPLLDGRPPVLLRYAASAPEQVVFGPDGRPLPFVPEMVADTQNGDRIGGAYTLAGNVITITDFVPGSSYLFSYEYSVFWSVARVRWYLGAPGQAADGGLQALFPGLWTAAHRADGIAYLVCEFDYDESAFPSGLPGVTARIRGAKLYDPRYPGAPAVWSEMPTLMMRHVLMHPQFGKRTSMTAAEDARIATETNACAAAMDYGGGVVNKYRAATVIPFGATAREALDDLSQAMGGQWAYAAGEIYMRAGVYQAPVMALGDADLAVVQRSNDGSVNQSPITIATHRARNEKTNSIAARIWDQSAGYVQTPISPFRSAAYVADDGAELVQEVTMPAVFNASQAFHIAGIMLRDARDPLTITLSFKLRAWPLELFDTVTLTLARYGFVAKEFQVLGRTFMPTGYVQLTLKETAAQIYQWGAGFDPAGYADNTALPNPWDIKPPVLISVSSTEADLVVQADGAVINAVRVVWQAIQDSSVAHGGSIEIQYRVLPETAWHSISVPGDQTQAMITAMKDGAYVVVRARARSSVAVSDWGGQVTVQANGKAARPPNIERLTITGAVLSWSLPRRVPDLAGFVFRFHYGNSLDWNSATPMHTGVLTQSPYDLVTRPSGVVTIMGKAIDTSGNVSAATANIVMDLGDPTIANVVESWNFNALGWPYVAAESSGWTLVGGMPKAGALDSFYGTDNQSFYDASPDSFYEPGAYGEMVYVSSEIIVIGALAGSIMTLDATTQGTDLRIEYRLAGPEPFYGLDGESFYDADDAAPLYGPPGAWLPWPGQIVAAREVYQFRITIGAGPAQGVLSALLVTIDAPDINESIADMVVGSGGTTIPYTKPFAAIKAVQATLQANGSGAVTVEIDKTLPLAPKIRAYNVAHTAVAGATVDISIQGY